MPETVSDPVVFYIFAIFTGAAVLATLALYARQSLLVAYIALGILLGPSVAGVVSDPDIVSELAHIGIIFLLFLLGISLPPQKLVKMLQETLLVAGLSSVVVMAAGVTVALAFGFSGKESAVVGAALMFSSTIIGLKLLPTTVLHHRRTGEIIISILLFQDLVAIAIIMLLRADLDTQVPLSTLGLLFGGLFALVLLAYLLERFVLIPLIRRFDKIREYIFLMAIGWCLGMAELASVLGLSAEIGAFIAGVVLATSPISMFIAESLKPLRDFFLVIFFFALGASFDLAIVAEVLLPAVLLAVLVIALKPWLFRWLLGLYGEPAKESREIGARLGQISEFSLIIAVLAFEVGAIGQEASYLVQVATVLTFIFSSYYIVFRFPTPIAVSDKLRRD